VLCRHALGQERLRATTLKHFCPNKLLRVSVPHIFYPSRANPDELGVLCGLFRNRFSIEMQELHNTLIFIEFYGG
ncbi:MULTISPECIES: hypothetical protein, partial [Vibrio]|uniref:hypothetical protein n=1 Tax=Vibrio TaxID=662 RepID=UPI00197E0F00